MFGNGVGVARWQAAQLDAPVTSSSQDAQPAARRETKAPASVQPSAPTEDVGVAMASALEAAMAAAAKQAVPEEETVATVSPAAAAPQLSAAVTSDGKDTSVEADGTTDFDTKLQYVIWAACLAMVIWRYVVAPV